MPLDQAAYVPAVGPRSAFIAGVRGSRLFTLNPTTGAKITESLLNYPTPMFGCVAYHSATDRIWMGIWSGLDDSNNGFTVNSRNDLYSIDPGNPTIAAALPLSAVFTAGSSSAVPMTYQNIQGGVRRIVPCGNWLAIMSNVVCFGAFKPVDLTSYFGGSIQVASNNPFSYLDIAYDAANGLAWVNAANSPAYITNLQFSIYPSGGFPHNVAGYQDNVFPNTWPYSPTYFPFGLCACQSNNCLYIATASTIIGRYNITANTWSQVNLGRINARPVAVRYNSVDGLMYIATWGDNTICVINPAGDIVTVKTGFDCPCDVVFTPTKKFAVQQGSVGLKEIV